MRGTKSPKSVSTKLDWIATLARNKPQAVLTTLAHHIDVDFLREAYRCTRKDGAVGVDRQTAEEYASGLDANLTSLLDRFKSGRYFAPPVRRVRIPKHDGTTRPIGVPTFEDKVLQRAVAMVMGAVYEQQFCACSYGFRPRRSAHTALAALWEGLTDMNGAWVIEADIQDFFGTLDHRCLRTILDQRVRDGVIRRAIDKWLKAGVLEDGAIWHPDEGTPQGGVISPLLANIYLHEVLDRWFEEDVKPRLRGHALAIRYADDFILAFASEIDARRVLEVLPKRFGKFGLKLHPEKTRLIEFRRPAGQSEPRCGSSERRPATFDLLGFTHHWGRSRKGTWIIKRRTMSSRFTRALRAITIWCRDHRHDLVKLQHRTLAQKLRGHYAYYGIIGNAAALSRFAHEVERIWRKWLNRRSQRARMAWDRFQRLKQRYALPKPRMIPRRRSEAAT